MAIFRTTSQKQMLNNTVLFSDISTLESTYEHVKENARKEQTSAPETSLTFFML